MSDFRIWAKINYIVPEGYVVAVSAISDTSPSNEAIVESAILPSHDEALQIRDEMIGRMGELIRSRGDRVVNVQAE